MIYLFIIPGFFYLGADSAKLSRSELTMRGEDFWRRGRDEADSTLVEVFGEEGADVGGP